MGILETRHGIITKSVLLLYLRSANESSREYKFSFNLLLELGGVLCLCQGLVRMSVSCQALSVLSIIRDNFLYIIIINIINQQSNTKNADNSPHFMTFCIIHFRKSLICLSLIFLLSIILQLI